MGSPPPEPRKEDAPKLASKEVWVPGYYQPVAGTWVWHQGEVREPKDGYTLIPAATREENGKFVFSPPRWRRSDLASQSQVTSTQSAVSHQPSAPFADTLCRAEG